MRISILSWIAALMVAVVGTYFLWDHITSLPSLMSDSALTEEVVETPTSPPPPPSPTKTPTPEPTPTPELTPTPTQAPSTRRYLDIGAQGDNTFVGQGFVPGDPGKLACTLGGFNDVTQRVMVQEAYSVLYLPVEPNRSVELTLCVTRRMTNNDWWKLWLDSGHPEQCGDRLAKHAPVSAPAPVETAPIYIPAFCVTSDTLVLVFTDKSDPGGRDMGGAVPPR